MAIHIVMVEPEIPPNTGNVARSCAITNSVLHLVEPLGFSIDEKSLKRAGLDYWPYVDVRVHPSLDAFMEQYGPGGADSVVPGSTTEQNPQGSPRRLWLATTQGGTLYTDVEFRDEDMILFGKETAGLPRDFIAKYSEYAIRIPMSENTRLRSLNLSNSVSIIMFEAMRQLGFPGLL